MSQFTTPLIVKQIEDTKYYKLLEGFEYHVGTYPSNDVIVVPAGFITDFASTPKVLHSVLPPRGKYGKAAVIHDYCYATACHGKTKSDQIFLEGMNVLNVPKWKSTTMFHGVVIFGWYGWWKHRSGRGYQNQF